LKTAIIWSIIGNTTDIVLRNFSKDGGKANNGREISDRIVNSRGSGKNRYSIKSRNEKYIMQFPMIISTAVSPEIVEALRNQIELERAFEFINVITNEPIEVSKDDLEKGGLLTSLHTNYYFEDVEFDKLEDGDEVEVGPDSAREVEAINKKQSKSLEEMVNNISLNDLSFSKFYKDKLNENIKVLEDNKEDYKATNISAKINDNFVSKNNASIPLYVQTDADVIYNAENKGNSESIKIKVNYGIKNMIHPINSEDIIYHLGQKVSRGNFLVNLVKLSTGEMSFIKDFLLDLNTAREYARRSKRGLASRKAVGSFGTLNSIYAENMLARLDKNNSRNVIPNAALIITSEEVNEIRTKNGMDILGDPKVAANISKKLSLIDFMIIDEINDKAYRFNSFANVWEPVNLRHMGGLKIKDTEKDRGMSEKDIKSLLKIR